MCDPLSGSPPGSSVPGILQARILEWVAISFSNACMHAWSLQRSLTLCYSRDSRPPASSVHRILQARILEWVAISFSIYMHTCRYMYTSISDQISRSVVSDSLRPMNRSTPGLPVHHQFLEFTQTHVHWVSDAIQPSHPVVPFSSCPQSLPACT